jgi:hypothetical protein
MDYDDYYDYDDFDNRFDDDYFEDEHLPQEVGCLPILLVVIGVALLLVWLNRAGISIPATTGVSDNLSGAISPGNKKIALLFTPEVQYWADDIAAWSQQTGIDPNLIATVMQIESCGDPRARSGAGAMGLFQVMPYHFQEGEDPYKPATNALRGLDYLRQALEARGGVVRLGFAGYNGGITGAKRPESAWPNETQRYVYWGTGIYEDAIKGKSSSDRLDEWLGRGGASLCKQAAQRLGGNP